MNELLLLLELNGLLLRLKLFYYILTLLYYMPIGYFIVEVFTKGLLLLLLLEI